MSKKLAGKRIGDWTNLGGQLLPTKEVDTLRANIGTGKLDTWGKVHQKYNSFWKQYSIQKQRHAFASWCDLMETDKPTVQQWFYSLEKVKEIQEYISDQVYISRKKDYDNPFRQATFRNKEEMIASIGTIDENSFIKQVRGDTVAFNKQVQVIINRG
jgi:hypothetical protein